MDTPAHKGCTVWFTGLSGAGKSTVSTLLAQRLCAAGAKVELLDGDMVRTRDENIRRIGFVCELLSRHGVIAIAAAISPYREVRRSVRARIPNFVEVYMECPMDVLIERDAKGLYKKALAGEIEHFTGISDPYESPEAPELIIHSSVESPEQSADRVWHTLKNLGLIAYV
jgi:adenylylsulfate kinase